MTLSTTGLMILKVEHMTGILLFGSGLLGCRILSLEELRLGGLLLRLQCKWYSP